MTFNWWLGLVVVLAFVFALCALVVSALAFTGKLRVSGATAVPHSKQRFHPAGEEHAPTAHNANTLTTPAEIKTQLAECKNMPGCNPFTAAQNARTINKWLKEMPQRVLEMRSPSNFDILVELPSTLPTDSNGDAHAYVVFTDRLNTIRRVSDGVRFPSLATTHPNTYLNSGSMSDVKSGNIVQVRARPGSKVVLTSD